jgi:hypothetical protein
MSGGSRIVAFGSGSEPQPEHTAPLGEAEPHEAWPDEDEGEAGGARPSAREWLAPVIAALAIAGWTGFFGWANRALFASGITPGDGAALIGAWAPPVLLVCVAWLLALRTSRREAARFGDAASLLAAESARLETRLTVVNRELSLAREFIAAQARDLDSLGRIAAERLSEHAERLQGLIRDNGAQVEAIATVSGSALDNMERLRSQLPVIASSAKDVANAIGHAGRTAHGQLDELTGGMTRLGEAGEASNRAVAGLEQRIAAALGGFDTRLDEIHQLVGARLEELDHRGAELRRRLDVQEAAALAALQERTAALGTEIEQSRETLGQHEAEALTSLRARLSALRDEGAALARSLRDGEAGAMAALIEAKDRVEAEIRGVVERLDQLDQGALQAARNRIATVSEEAGAFDDRLAERNQLFAAETEKRLNEAAARHDAEVARLTALFERLDHELTWRQSAQAEHQQRLAAGSEAIAGRLDVMAERIAAIAAFGTEAEETLGSGLRVLADKLGSSREALAGTDAAVVQLTDGAVRLLELLQASTEQSREQLPAALSRADARLAEWETRVGELRGAVDAAAVQSTDLAHQMSETRAALGQSLDEIGTIQNVLGEGAARHAGTLDQLRQSLAALDRESLDVASKAQGELSGAIERLGEATRAAVITLGDDTQGAVAALAQRLGEESGAAIDRVMRLRMAEAVGQLEQAAAHAAGVSREAAIQLRDQLARVDELAGNLEQRVAQARSRAEEQVDNDFARRVALITESLNSNAIDIAKALSSDVTDTAWAAYLRGDRGVFTRRAVKLIDTAEAREIARIYDEDREFRDHVSRYIHDFEAMLRQLLSTRDGHALGVTLLSSDMGKLYVVLAQAIERLRA